MRIKHSEFTVAGLCTKIETVVEKMNMCGKKQTVGDGAYWSEQIMMGACCQCFT